MKSLLRIYIFHVLALYFTTQLLDGSFKISGGIENLLIAGGILSLFNMLLKPILKLLFFPINALTLGLFSLVINTAVFYLFIKAVSQVSIDPWTFPGFSYQGFSLPPQHLMFWGTLFVISFLVSLITNFLLFLVK